jgi:D-alanine--poly(phosphoribitol) ligase subunit 1
MITFNNLREAWDAILSRAEDHPAMESAEEIWTYSHLDKRSNQIAKWFNNKKISRYQVIAIVSTKNFHDYAVMLACLKLGITYVNLDPDNPPERLKKILETCAPALVLGSTSVAESVLKVFEDLGLLYINYNEKQFSHYSTSTLRLEENVIGNTPAYIMFTSGSTGIPKGVTITHSNLLSFISWSVSYYKAGIGDRFAQLSPMYFDNSVFDFYTAMFSGACLVPIPKSLIQDARELILYVERMRCTIWFSVPSLLVYLLSMRVLLPESLPSIRVITFGGEGFPKTELRKLYRLIGARSRLINVYGPTEGTCICSAYQISEKDFEDMSSLAPLGKINPNFEYLILDEELKSVGPGAKGELCIIGPNISPGYYNDAERTAQQFVQHSTMRSFPMAMYRTGDIVFECNEILHFCGRIDNQIKHMGYRIELEEVEAALHGLLYVNQSGVVYHRIRPQYGHIVAFVSLSTRVDESQIKSDLLNFLPSYMIPNRFEVVDQLPKNSNGKVDRNALLRSLVRPDLG